MDAVLDLYNVDTRLGPALTAAAVGVAAVALLGASRGRGGGAGPAWPLLVGVGVLVAQQPDDFVLGRSDDYRPSVATLIVILGWALTIAAAVLALAAGPWPPSRGRVRGAAAVGALMLVLAVVGGGFETRGWLPGLALLWSLPFWLLPLLVALSGALPRGRRGVLAFLGLTFGGYVVASSISFGERWPLLLRPHTLAYAYPWAAATGVLVSSVVLGVALVVSAGLTRRFRHDRPAPAAEAPAAEVPAAEVPAAEVPAADAPAQVGPATVRGGWRFRAGVFLASAGLAAWLVTALQLQPQIAALVADWRSPADGVFRVSLQGQNDVDGFGWDLRWAGIALAAAGLRLLAPDRRWRRSVAVAVVTWCVAEFALLAMSVASARGTPRFAGIIGTLAVVGVAVLIDRRLPGRASPPVASGGAGRGFVYASAVAGVAVFSLHSAGPLMAENLPAWGLAGAFGLSVLLVVAAVLTALVAAPAPVRPARALVAVVVAVGGGAAVLALGAWRLTGSYLVGGAPNLERLLVPAAVLGTLVLGCALIAGVLPAARSVAGAGLVAVAAPGVAVGATGVAFLPLVLAFLALPGLSAWDGPFTIDESATPLTLTGVAAGVTLAILALAPRELSTLDAVGSPSERPTPPSAPVPPAPAPVAIPGVPEILEWPVAARR